MLLLAVVALISTGAFFRASKRSGHHPGKMASLPFLALGIVTATNYLAFPLLERLLTQVVSSAGITALITIGYNIFVACLYLVLIRHTWQIVNRPKILITDPTATPGSKNGG